MSKIYRITLVALVLVMLVSCAPAPTPTAVPPTAAPTAVPATAVPPTKAPAVVPPTAVPPTAVPPTAVPPTAAPTKVMPPALPTYTGVTVTIRFAYWGNDDRVARTNRVIDLFQAAYPLIKVTGEPKAGTTDHFQVLDTQLAGNAAPDLIQFGGNYPDYTKYLQPLDSYLGKQLLIDTPARFDQTALIPATVDGKLWCISLGTNTLVLVYNRTAIEAAGVALPKDNMTWDELLAYGKDLKAKLPKTMAPFVDNSTNQANYLSFYYRQQGTPLWTSESGGKSYATVDSAKKWLQMWADLRTQGLIVDADTTATYAENGADTSALVAGKAAIGLIWSNQIAAYQAAMKDKLGATTLPKAGQKSYAIQMSQYMGINKASKNIEAAALFINFFVTAPEAGAVLGTNRGVPSSPVVRTAISGQATEADAAVYRIYNAVADRTIPQDPNLPNDQQFVNELRLIGQAVSLGKSSVDKGATDLQALIERMTKK
jgi:multiple sugar transport system substrate-binding protein